MSGTLHHASGQSSTGTFDIEFQAVESADELLWDGTRRAIDRAGIEIVKVASHGVTTAVFQVQQQRTGRRLALKVCLDPDNRKALTAFRREQRLLASEFVPNQVIPRYVTSVAGEEMQPFVVMEWIDGKSLTTCVESSQRHPLTERLRLAVSLLTAVETLHQNNILHGDLTADHAIIDDRSQVRVVSFGRTRRIERPDWPRPSIAGSHPASRLAQSAHSQVGSHSEAWNDLRPAAGLAFQVLTGCPPHDVGKSPRQRELNVEATYRSELQRHGVPQQLQDVILKGLRQRDERGAIGSRYYESAGQMAEELQSWLPKRRSIGSGTAMLLTLTVALLAIATVGLTGWTQRTDSGTAAQWQELALLRQQTEEFQSLDYPAIDNALKHADQALTRHEERLANGEDENVDALLTATLSNLRSAIKNARGIERATPVRLALRQVLSSVPWVRDSRFISERLSVLESRFRRAGQQLDSGRTDVAWRTLCSLERDLAQLMRDNSEAATASRAKTRFNELQAGVSDRLRALDQFAAIDRRAQQAASVWNDGNWAQAAELFHESHRQLRDWLKGIETFEERTARLLADTDLVAELSSREQATAAKLVELAAARDEIAGRFEELTTAKRQIDTELDVVRQAATQRNARLDQALATKESVETKLNQAERDLASTHQKLAMLQAELKNVTKRHDNQETARRLLERRVVELSQKLTAAESAAQRSSDQADQLRRQLALWKQHGDDSTAAAIELARQADEVAIQIRQLSDRDRSSAEQLVRDAYQKQQSAKAGRNGLLTRYQPDSDAVRRIDEQLMLLDAALTDAVRKLHEIDSTLHAGLKKSIAAEQKRFEALTVTRGLKPDAEEPQNVLARIQQLTRNARRYEDSLDRMQSGALQSPAAVQQFARHLSFHGQTAGQRLLLATSRENAQTTSLRWAPADSPSIDHGFWILETEVTQKLFEDVTRRSLSDQVALRSIEVDAIGNESASVPMYFVSLDDAQQFCERLTEQLRRADAIPDGWHVSLPSESQWIHAATAGRTRRNQTYPDEFQLSTTAWFEGNSGSAAQPVGQKSASPWGLRDIVGNVYEWVISDTNTDRGILRGGSWGSPAQSARASSRRVVDPSFRTSEVGFRFIIQPVE
ncbi:MAG: SUMF1/EgtB/PvdO family nonheme iron enzyme [Planctomycetota bacterium]|jgi:formylglycine-generating enzyme required for sulfatase activity